MRKLTEQDKKRFSKMLSSKDYTVNEKCGMVYALAALGYITPESLRILEDNVKASDWGLDVSRETYQQLFRLER